MHLTEWEHACPWFDSESGHHDFTFLRGNRQESTKIKCAGLAQ